MGSDAEAVIFSLNWILNSSELCSPTPVHVSDYESAANSDNFMWTQSFDNAVIGFWRESFRVWFVCLK